MQFATANFGEFISMLINALGARFRPGSGTKRTVLGAFQTRFVVAIS
jgi:hypothetical protein